MNFIALVGVAVLIGALVLFVTKYPKVKPYIPHLTWALGLVVSALDHWQASVKYRKASKVARLSGQLLTYMVEENKEARKLNEPLSVYLDKVSEVLFPGQKIKESDKRLMLAAYSTATSYYEISEVLSSIQGDDYSNLEVKKATTVFIDVLGQVTLLKDELGQEYFQAIIYGINKILRLIRDGGTDRKTLKKATSALFRIYRIIKAYRKRRKLQGMTAGEVYDKILEVIEHIVITVSVS